VVNGIDSPQGRAMINSSSMTYIILAISCMIAAGYFSVLAWQFTSRANAASPAARESRRFQFSLSTLMIYGVPFVAAATWIVIWKGPYEQDFLNTNAKANMFIVLCDVFANILIVRYFWKRHRRAAATKGPIEPRTPEPVPESPLL
jgi:hypothetical protein